MDNSSILTISPKTEIPYYGPLRALCSTCGHRFPWPPGAPPVAIEPFVRPEIACPFCWRVGPLTGEPCDENWWAYLTGSDTEPEVVANPKPKKAAVPVTGGSIE